MDLPNETVYRSNRQYAFDQNYLPNTDKTKDKAFKSDLDTVVVHLCDPMDCSTPGLSVHHQLPELPQTHVL